MLRELEQWPDHTVLLDALAMGLRAQAAWLHYAGETESAQQALALAGQMRQLPLPQNPLLARMLAVGIGKN
jgi:hypothetical protein